MPGWLRLSGIALSNPDFAELKGMSDKRQSVDAGLRGLMSGDSQVRLAAGCKADCGALLRMFWGSCGPDLRLNPERMSLAQFNQGADLTQFHALPDTTGAEPADPDPGQVLVSPFPVGIMVRWGLLLGFGPDVAEGADADRVDAAAQGLGGVQARVWSAFCGAGPPDGARGGSVGDFADALDDLLKDGAEVARPVNKPVIHKADRVPRRFARPAAQPEAAGPAGPVPAPPAAGFVLEQAPGSIADRLAISLGADGIRVALASLQYQALQHLLPEPSGEAWDKPYTVATRELRARISPEGRDWDVRAVNARTDMLRSVVAAKSGSSTIVHISAAEDGYILPPGTQLCPTPLPLGTPVFPQQADRVAGLIEIFANLLRIEILHPPEPEGQDNPRGGADADRKKTLSETLQDSIRAARVEIGERLRRNDASAEGFLRLGGLSFGLSRAP